MWSRGLFVVLVSVCVALASVARNALFGWGLFAIGVTLHRGEEYERGLVLGLGISALLWIGGVASSWYHCLGYSCLCTATLRSCHEFLVLAIGVGCGVTTWMVCLTLGSEEALRPWGPYWVAAWIGVMWRAEDWLRRSIVWFGASFMVVLGWELGSESRFGMVGTLMVVLTFVFGANWVRLVDGVRSIRQRIGLDAKRPHPDTVS